MPKYSISIIFILSFCTAVSIRCQVPVSPRSLEAIARQSPILEEQLERKDLKLGSPVFIRVFKEEQQLELWIRDENEFQLFKTYEICYYSGDLGPKTFRGDNQSPEGYYYVTDQRMNPWSNFHLSMNLGYPNQYDRLKGYTGDYLMIHGACVSIGCYAMTDSGIEEIYTLASAALNHGQSFFRVHIFPFRMNNENMAKHRDSNWYRFWQNLKTGYDWFQRSKQTPNTEVLNGKYVFN